MKRFALRGETIEAVGVVLYGTQWQRQLARRLGVSEITIRRWRIRQSTMPAAAAEQMDSLIEQRRLQLDDTQAQLRSEMAA